MQFPNYLSEIQSGTFHKHFPYSNIESKQDFLKMLQSCSEPLWTVEQKWDGWFSVLCEKGLFSKTGKLIRNDLRVPVGHIYCCECLIGTQWSLKHAMHDKLVIHWSNQPYGSFFDSSWGIWVPRFLFSDVQKNIDGIVKGYEGLVLKNLSTGEFYRWKLDYTGDYVITGISKSDSASFIGKAAKAIEIGLYVNGSLVDCGSVSGGIDYSFRVDLFQNPQKYIGRVIEVSGKGIFDSGRMRHPTLVRFRDDLKPEMCTMAQFKVASDSSLKPSQKSYTVQNKIDITSKRKKCPVCKRFVSVKNGVLVNHGPSYDKPCSGGGTVPRKKEITYEQYDTSKGFGSKDQWKAAFQARLSKADIDKILGGKTAYEILEISETASIDEIKAAFRKKSLLYHPDKNYGVDVDGRFLRIRAAYEKLVD